MIHWNPSPEVVQFGALTIRWYGLLFGAGFLFGKTVFSRLNNQSHLISHEAELFTYIFAGTLIGARLGHCLFYDPTYYFAHPLEIPMVWKGGLASHGGALGIFTAIWLFCRRYSDNSVFAVLDLLAAPTAFAGCAIRLGNLMNSEIIGKPSSVPWAVVFLRVDSLPRHPTQIYESFFYLVMAALLYHLARSDRPRRTPGVVFGTFLIGVFGFRFLIEFLKENQSAFESSLPIDMGQILSLPLIGAGLYLLFRSTNPRSGYA